ncbi:deaminase domain-containing protein [Vibrio gazogenes]|uniref:Toxin CdiA n=1 Tax=Vibrio gazogenes TaxID=687 RepID=A0A1Z2SL86_VIBGA|nr:deaminase domain-containing protein [Vibrio gazogenes]ASA57867.1 hypothetical protein BSQ33_19285 [Vibrio gazogenes]
MSLQFEAQIKLSGLVGGIAGLIVTGDESGITAGQSAGEGVYANNYLNHNEAIRLDKELNSCQDPSSCQKVIDKYRALSDKNSQELQAACARHPMTCTAHYQKLVSNGLDATEIPDWVPLNDSMSNEQAIEFVRAVNREDQEYINTHTSLADKVLPVVSDPEVQFGLLTGAVIVKDLALAVSNGAKNLFGNAGKVVTSEVSAAGSASGLTRSRSSVPNRRQIYLSNSTNPEVRQSLLDRSRELRGELPSKLKREGNVGVAQIEIEGQPLELKAHSKINYSGDKGSDRGFTLLKPQEDWVFTPKKVNSDGYLDETGYLRHADTEFKLLEDIASRLGSDKAAIGKINLFTERQACQSCGDVILDFRNRYPNIQLNIFLRDIE